MLGGNGETQVGTPLVDGAKVVAEVLEHLRADKIRIMKYKNKTRRRQRMGHRQDLTRLQVKEIVGAGGVVTKVEKPKRRADARPSGQKKAEPKPEPEAVAEVAVEEAPTEEAPKPRRARTPKPAAEPAAESAPTAEASAKAEGEDQPEPKPRARRSKAEPVEEAEGD